MSALAEILAVLSAVGAAFLTLWAMLRAGAKADAEAERAAQADADALQTRERIDDATRDVPQPDAARDWLSSFGDGANPPER